MFLKTSNDGEVTIDHSASPGFTPAQARRLDLPPELTGEGKKMSAASLGCPHCGSHVILNPLRIRARAHCYICNKYICDICDGVRHEPDYCHTTIDEIAAKVASGKWIMAGSMSKPILIPVEE
jgi:predicted RNA-binding Zn-ribbon protein involved in translation (DUF1610 family)